MATDRILIGKNNAGVNGFWLSKAGFDVKTANILQMAFNGDISVMRLVAKGSISISPVSGVAPFGSGVTNGAKQSIGTIAYGRTISPAPFVAAIATASSWPLPLAVGTAQLGYLNGNWHTYIFEQPSTQLDGAYGPQIKRTSPPAVAKDVEFTWASCRFTANIYNTGVDFVTNCANTVTVKYLIMEQV